MPVRPPAVAGRFYPSEPDRLRDQVERLLADAAGRPAADADQEARPKALIVPHAGYRFSGPVAASGYARLTPWASDISRRDPARDVPHGRDRGPGDIERRGLRHAAG